MSNLWVKNKPILLYLLRCARLIAVVGFLFLVSVFWYTYIKETSWGFNRLSNWWVYLITISIFSPWELAWGVRKTQAYLSVSNKVKKRKQDLLNAENTLVSALSERSFKTRLLKASLVLIPFMFLAEKYIVLELSTTSQLRNIWYSTSYAISNIIHRISGHIITIGSVKITYEIRGFIFYIIGLIVFRQGIRYIFSSTIKKYEFVALQRLEEVYGQPNKTKLISYALLASIILVFITFILNQGNYSLTVPSPFEAKKPPSPVIFISEIDPLQLDLVIQDFDLKNSKVTGILSISETKHVYKEGKCEDLYTTQCDLYECNDVYSGKTCGEATGFPPIISGQTNILINGKNISVAIENDKASATDINFTNQVSGNNYFFPFNEYTSKITISPSNFWDYAKINISTNHRFFSIYQDKQSVTNNGTFYYKLGYAPYYKILVVVIFFALLSFLGVLWQTSERETLLELSVGIFAAIITIRGFLIPQEFSTDPIFLDQVLLIYIALFMFILLYKYEATKKQNSA